MPKKGDVVSFTYQSFSRAVPLFPRLTRIRTDLEWRDVLREYSSSSTSPSSSSTTLPSLSTHSSPSSPSHNRVPRSASPQRPRDSHSSSTEINHTLLENRRNQPIEEQPKRHNYWMVDNHKNVRGFFERLAHRLYLDPLLPDSWYSLTIAEVLKMKVSILV